MEYSYRFRIYPNKEQEKQIQKNFGCCRFVFNYYLARRVEQYRETGKTPSRFEQDRDLIEHVLLRGVFYRYHLRMQKKEKHQEQTESAQAERLQKGADSH